LRRLKLLLELAGSRVASVVRFGHVDTRVDAGREDGSG
jgi:hypothetical protein